MVERRGGDRVVKLLQTVIRKAVEACVRRLQVCRETAATIIEHTMFLLMQQLQRQIGVWCERDTDRGCEPQRSI